MLGLNSKQSWWSSHSSSYKQLGPPSFPLALLFSAQLFLGRQRQWWGGETG